MEVDRSVTCATGPLTWGNTGGTAWWGGVWTAAAEVWRNFPPLLPSRVTIGNVTSDTIPAPAAVTLAVGQRIGNYRLTAEAPTRPGFPPAWRADWLPPGAAMPCRVTLSTVHFEALAALTS